MNHTIQSKLKEFGNKKKIKELQDYVATIDLEQLSSFLEENICLRNGLLLWKYLLQGFSNSSESQEKRFQVSLFVLEKMDQSDVSSSHANDVITSLLFELPNFKANHLIAFCDFCMDRIQKGSILHTNWKDLLPEILNILEDKECITYNNTEMSGSDFKNQIISTLCTINWSPNIITILAAMFKDISLSKEEHLQVVTKLGQSIDKLTCQELPAFTFQLLKLCRTENSRCIFLRLQYYFSNRIYKNLGKDLDPSSDTTDLDEIADASERDAIEVESTILYHIQNEALLGQTCIKEYINSLKDLIKAPEFVLHPFQLTVLLSISSTPIFQEQTIDIVRSCIVKVINEENKKVDSAWFRNIVTCCTKTSNIISVVLENSAKDRPIVNVGLVHLAFALLSTGAALGQKNIAEAQWQLGTFILLKLMKKRRETSATVIKRLCNLIITQNSLQLTECLHQMCRSLTHAMLENQCIIIHLTEEILELPAETSRCIIDAVIPLVKVSPTIRDNLILLLRKALFSKKVEIRQMAASGYLKLLKNLKLSNLGAFRFSQSYASSSNYSCLTQIYLEQARQSSNMRFSNEALCLEVLDILRRCFMQQAEVRSELYDGLYDSFCINSELGLPALNMLRTHFDQFYKTDDLLPPIIFANIVDTKNVTVTLWEPIAHLIYAIGLIVTKLKESHDESDPRITRNTEMLDTLCDKMAKCELIHFDLDTGRDLLDNLPECQTHLHILKQAMSVYEALMGYLICSWNSESENVAQKIFSLFQAYSRLVDFSKNLSKPKKADGRKNKKDDTQQNKTNTNTKAKIFKPEKTVLDFQVICKMLALLHEQTISWANVAQTNILKVKKEFHRYVLNTAIQLVQNVKVSKSAETMHTKPYFRYCTKIAAILYERVIKRLSYVLDFDCVTAVLAVECFNNIFNLIVNNYKEKLIDFLSVVGSKNKDDDLCDHLMPFIEYFQSLFEKEEDEFSDDAEAKKIPPYLVNIYTIFVLNLPHQGPSALKVLDWLKQYTNNNQVKNKQVGTGLISLLLHLSVRCKSESALYENIAIKLCDIIGAINHEKVECAVELKILNEATALPALNNLSNVLKTMLNEADWLIQRCRAEYNMIIYPGADKIDRRRELLKNKERDLCCHLCRIIDICRLMSNMAVPPGLNAEIIFKILMHLFNTLNSLTKYFLLISSKINPAFQNARFERVLKLAGKPLSNTVYDFILYIEEGPQSDDESTTQAKKKSSNPTTLKTKILRETRLIPKLVYEIEQFGRNVITLSNKTKIDLSKYVGLGTSRDFRIKAPELKQALEKITNNADESMVTVEENDEVMEVVDEAAQENSSDDVDEQEENEATETPAIKKARKSK